MLQRTFPIAVAAVLGLGSVAVARDTSAATGSICIAAVEDDGLQRSHYSEKFAVRIDGDAWTGVPFGRQPPTWIGDIPAQGKHLVSIRDGEKRIESFRFSFDDYGSTALCLWYKQWYGSWSLSPADQYPTFCRCSPRS